MPVPGETPPALDLVVNDLPIRVHRIGTDVPDDPTFVLLHGIGVSSVMFANAAQRLEPEGRVLLIDLPGFGGVPLPKTRIRIADLAALVRATLRQLDVHNCVLIGHSMGAQVAVEMQAVESSPCSATLLIGPVADPRFRRLPKVLAHFLQSAVHENVKDAAVSVRAYVASGPWWVRRLLPTIIGYPIQRRLAQVRGAVTILRGDHDRLCTEEWVEQLARAAVSASAVRTAVIEGAAHQVVVGDAHEVAAEARKLADFQRAVR